MTQYLSRLARAVPYYALIPLLLLNNIVIAAPGKSTASEYAVKAAYIYNILHFVSWDDDSELAQSESLNVCLFKGNPFQHDLEPIKKKAIDGKKIRITTYDRMEQTPGCHLIFVDDSDKFNADIITYQSTHNEVILLGNDIEFIKNGGLFSFYIANNKVKLAANKNALAKTKLNISALLIEVCQLYGEGQ